MSQNLNNFINQIVSFTFESSPSIIRVDSISDNVNFPPHQSIKLCPDDSKKILFAYTQGDGLIRVGESNGKKRIKNILGEFLKYKSDDYNGLLNFFDQYGFLFNTKSDSFQKLELKTLTRIHNRLNALLELINCVNDVEETNVKRIIELSLYLLFEDEWSIELNTGDYITSTKYSLKDTIDYALDVHEKDHRLEVIKKGTFTVNDALYGDVELTDSIYREIVNGPTNKSGWDDFRFKSLTYLYANYDFKNNEEKEIIHLLFNFFFKVGIPKEITHDNVSYFSHYNYQAFDEFTFLDYALDMAKYIIKKELEHHLINIRPLYDADNMQPRWSVPSLLDALYFSIFYLDSKTQMYRQCKYCGRYFTVKRSNTTKIYCDGWCRNNSQQSRHRIKSKKAPRMD